MPQDTQRGFKATKNGTKHVTVKNKPLLKDLRRIESGKWVKVYKNGYVNGKKFLFITLKVDLDMYLM